VTPPPTPTGTVEQGLIWRAWAAINARRASKGLGSVQLDQALCRAAATEAIPLANGDVTAHWEFPERVFAQGWTRQECGARSGYGNMGEGITWGCGTPEYAATFLDDDPNPLEGHRRDFEDPSFNRVGIWMVEGGGLGGYTCVVEWAAECGTPQPSAPRSKPVASAATFKPKAPAAPYPGMKIQGPVASGATFRPAPANDPAPAPPAKAARPQALPPSPTPEPRPRPRRRRPRPG
jgi:hypothetical protein